MGTQLGSAGVRIELHDKSGYEVVETPSAIAGVVGFAPKGELNKIISLSNTANQDNYLGFGYQLAKYNQGMYAARAVLSAGGHVEFVRPYGEEIDKSNPYKRDLKTDAFVVTYDRNAYRDDYPYAKTSFNIKHFAATRYKTDAASEYGLTRKINNIAETVASGKNVDFGLNAGDEFKDSNACRWYDSTKKKSPTDVVLFSMLNTDPSAANRAFTAYEISDVQHASGSTALICTITSKPGFVVDDIVYLPVSNGGSSTSFARARVADIIDFEVTLEVLNDDYFSTGNQKPNTIIYCDDVNAIADGCDYLNVRTAVAGRGVKTFSTIAIGDYSGNTAYDPQTSIRHGQFIEVFDAYKQSMLIRFENTKFVETNSVVSCEAVPGTEDMYVISVGSDQTANPGSTDSIIIGDTITIDAVVDTATGKTKKINFEVTDNDRKAEKLTVKCSNNSEFVALTDYLSSIENQFIINQLQDNDAILRTDISAITSWDEFGAIIVSRMKDDSIGYTDNLVANDIKELITKDGVCNVVKVDPSAAYEYAIGDTVAIVLGRSVFDTTDCAERTADDKWVSVIKPSRENSIITGTISGLNVMAGEITLAPSKHVVDALTKLPDMAITPMVELSGLFGESAETASKTTKTCTTYILSSGDLAYKSSDGAVYVYDSAEGFYKTYTSGLTTATLVKRPYVYQIVDLTQSNMTTYNTMITDSWTVTETEEASTTANKLGDPIEYSSNTVMYDRITDAATFISKWCDADGNCKIKANDRIVLTYPEYATIKLKQAKVKVGTDPEVDVYIDNISGTTPKYYNVVTGAEVTGVTDIGTETEVSKDDCLIYTVTKDNTDFTQYSLVIGSVKFIVNTDGYVKLGDAATGATQKLVNLGFIVSDVKKADGIITGKAIISNTLMKHAGDAVGISMEKVFSVDYNNVYIIGSYSMYVSSSEQDAVQCQPSEGINLLNVQKGVHTATSTTAIAARSSKILADSNIGQSFLGLVLAKTSYEDVDFTGEARQVYVLTDEGANVARIYLGVSYMFNGKLYDFEGTVVPYVHNDTQLDIVQAADYELTGSGAKFVLNESGILDAFLDNNAYDLSQTVVDDVLNGSLSCISFNVDDPAIRNDAVWKYDPVNNRSGSTLSTVWSLFLDKDKSDIDFVVAAGTDINNLFMKNIETVNTQVIEAILNLCETRKDCFALLDGVGEADIEKTLKKYNAAAQFQTNLGRWGALYDGRGLVFDSYYTHSTVEIVKSIQMASLITSNRSGGIFWHVPSGEKKGRVPAAWGTTEKYPRRFNNAEDMNSDIARLTNMHMNPTRMKKNGTFIWGDFTLQQDDTALNQIHAIMLIAGVHKMFYKFLDGKVFQLNTAALRQDIQTTLQKKLDSITTSKPAGFYEAVCVCDDTNNTPDLIDQGKLFVDLRMRITKSTRYIYLRSTVLPTKDGNQVSTELI